MKLKYILFNLIKIKFNQLEDHPFLIAIYLFNI